MKVTMLSHASVLLKAGPVSLCTDPWFSGAVFNESWSLLCEPAVTATTLPPLTHIWISHEHPDHLHYPTLKAIPQDQKDRIVLLYQEHFSSRMVRALRAFGFQAVRELPLGRWVLIGEGVEVLCYSVESIDSLLGVRANGVTILNLNDCVLSPQGAVTVARRVGSVDVLLTQFSIAGWAGNPGETDVPSRLGVLHRLERYVALFKPKLLIPFASFVYFSHEENRYMNRWVNTPDQVMEFMRSHRTPVQFLANGDSWSSDKGVCMAGDPLGQYRQAFASLPHRPYRHDPPVATAELLALGTTLVSNVRKAFPRFLLRTLAAPIHFYVDDLHTSIRFDVTTGDVVAGERSREQCDMALNSQALWYAFKFPWGLGTLNVSGRYMLLNPQMNKRAIHFCHFYASDITVKSLLKRIGQRRAWRFMWIKRREILDSIVTRLNRILSVRPT